MIVDGPWISEPATQAVCAAMADQGFQVYFVGGCVRNALLGVEVSDIDLASNALPEDTIRCAEAAGLRAIPTGIEHGTITVVSGGIAHEITTFRSDVETHGRRAEVRFSKSVKEDAERRDFTMNAIYAGPDGTILDPLNGLPDLVRRHVRFIGDAGQRIQEDYLRSLRFFRFTAWYGDPALGIDSEGLAAVAAHLDGLSGLSRERVGAEIKKLLAAPDPSMAVAAMAQSGVLSSVLAGSDPRALAPLVHFEQSFGITPDPIRRLAGLADFPDDDDLRLSKDDRKNWRILREEVGAMKGAGHLGYLYGAPLAIDVLLLRAALLETPLSDQAIQESKKGESAVFPVKAQDLPEHSGSALGAILKQLKALWIASDFSLTKDDLLS